MKNKVLPRKKIDRKYRWNAESVFPSDEAWEEEVSRIIEDIKKVKKYQGRLAEGPSVLLDALKAADKLILRARQHPKSTTPERQCVSRSQHHIKGTVYKKSWYILCSPVRL